MAALLSGLPGAGSSFLATRQHPVFVGGFVLAATQEPCETAHWGRHHLTSQSALLEPCNRRKGRDIFSCARGAASPVEPRFAVDQVDVPFLQVRNGELTHSPR